MNNKHEIELKNLGIRIQQKRKARGLTQEEVAYRMGCSLIRTFSNERFLGYARKALLHQCAAIAKQQDKFPATEDLGKNEPDPAEPIVDFVERRATREEIRLCIEKLSPRYRFILYLKYFENRSCDEVGAIMGLKESNVRTLLTRARAQLKLIYMRDILHNNSECSTTCTE